MMKRFSRSTTALLCLLSCFARAAPAPPLMLLPPSSSSSSLFDGLSANYALPVTTVRVNSSLLYVCPSLLFSSLLPSSPQTKHIHKIHDNNNNNDHDNNKHSNINSSDPPSDPFIYPVPASSVTVKLYNYGDPVPLNPALICLNAARHDLIEHADRKLDKVVGVPLEYRFRGVVLTAVPTGRALSCECSFCSFFFCNQLRAREELQGDSLCLRIWNECFH